MRNFIIIVCSLVGMIGLTAASSYIDWLQWPVLILWGIVALFILYATVRGIINSIKENKGKVG